MSECLKVLSYNVRGIRDERKRRALYSYLREQNCDVILLQETHCKLRKEAYRWGKEWEGQSIWSRGSSNSKGVTILFKNGTQYDVIEDDVDQNGRHILCTVKLNEMKLHIMNVYAPNNEYERVKFFNDIQTHFVNADGCIIIGGDFNCVINNDIDRKNCKSSADIGQIDLSNVMNNFDLEDVWRRRNPNQLEFSWESRGKMSRIDYFLVSESLDSQVKDIQYLYAPFSDHRPVFLKLKTSDIIRGPGIWKMNASVIKTELFKNAFTSMWKNWKKKKSDYTLDVWWDLGKKMIKELSQNISKMLAREKKIEQEIISNRICFLKERNGNQDEIKHLEEKLKVIYEEKGRGTKIRSRAKWWEEGERSTAYFHGLERKRGKEKLWDCILDENGREVSGIEAIQNRQLQFYEGLYKK